METVTHKKLIVFDVNLDWNSYKQEDHRYQDLPLVYSLMKKASKYQTIVIQTSNCLVDLLDFANKQDLNKGYLIASGGAIIYDLAQRKIISSNPLDNDDVRTIIHHGLMDNANIGIYTTDRKFMYVSNTVSYSLMNKRAYSEHEVINTYELLEKTLQRTDIVDISFSLLLGSLNNRKQNVLLYNVDRFFEGETTTLNINANKTTNFVHISSKDSTKIKAIEKIMAIEHIELLSDVLYIAASCINTDCFISFKNCLVTSNTDFTNEIGNKPCKYLANEQEKLDPEFGLKSNSFWK